MQLNQLKPANARIKTPRVGRGGTRGKTSGRGTKGQNARAGHKKRPEIRDILKKIPKRRGHGKNRSRTVRVVEFTPVPVNLKLLEANFEAGALVTPKTLYTAGLLPSRGGRLLPVKILGTGTLTKKLEVSSCAVSESAKRAIEAVGGSVL